MPAPTDAAGRPLVYGRDRVVAAHTARPYNRQRLRIFVFLHVLTMFVAVALSGGGQIFLLAIANRRNPAAIRDSFAADKQLVRYIRVLFPLGLVFGLIAVFVHRFDPFAPWLLLAYVLFVAGVVTGAVSLPGR